MIRSQSFGRLRVALLAVGCFVGAGHSQAADAAVLIDSFTSCSPDFFSSLEANVTALGPSTVHESGDADPMQGGAAMFAAPVEVRGLHLTSFIQATPQKEAPTRYYRWGFQVTETPEVAAKAISSFARDANFRERRGEFGWVMDLERDWKTQNDGTAIEHRSPTRMMLIRPSREPGVAGSYIECGVQASQMTGHEVLPKISVVFGVAP